MKRRIAPTAALAAATGGEQEGPAEEEGIVAGLKASADERIAEATACLEKVKGLLPSACRLAFAVNSAESERVTAEVQQVREKVAHATMDRKELENSVSNALEALWRLQQAAVTKATSLLQADSSLRDFPSLGSREGTS